MSTDRRAQQRAVPKHPHKPSSQRMGARMRDDLDTRLSRAFAFMSKPMVLHPIDWHAVRFLPDGTVERVLGPELESVGRAFKTALGEVTVHGPV